VLETPEERVRLLRAGLTGKTIERLYVINNNFKIIRSPLLVEHEEVTRKNRELFFNDTSAECLVV